MLSDTSEGEAQSQRSSFHRKITRQEAVLMYILFFFTFSFHQDFSFQFSVVTVSLCPATYLKPLTNLHTNYVKVPFSFPAQLRSYPDGPYLSQYMQKYGQSESRIRTEGPEGDM